MVRWDSPDRAQTAHDFALGMGVFLLTVAFVFGTMTTLGVLHDGDTVGVSARRGARVADTAVDKLSVAGEPTRLDPTRTAVFFRDHRTATALGRALGLPERSRVNVSIMSGTSLVNSTAPDGRRVTLGAGDRLAAERAATVVRAVTFAGEVPCRPSCRLVVRVG